MTALTDCLAQRKIGKIISIDDENAQQTIESIEGLVNAVSSVNARLLARLAKENPRFVPIAARRSEVEDESIEDRRAILRPRLEEIVAEQKLQGIDFRQAAQLLYPKSEGRTASKLRGVLPDGILQAVSFVKWGQEKEEYLKGATANSRLLLLVDERNELERATTDVDGTKLIAQLWSGYSDVMRNVDTIVVTASCQPQEEFETSRKLLAAIRHEVADPGIRPNVRRAFVISKARLEGKGLDTQFCIHLDRIAATDLQIDLAKLAGEALQRAMLESFQWLEEIPLSEFHGSVFLSSQNEGAAEIDTLLRLVGIRQRAVLERELGTPSPLKSKIAQMRRFSQKHIDGDYKTAANIELRKLRQQEFERPGEVLNALFVPISSGDVFHWTEIRDGRTEDRWAILLANPCDLMLRKNGRRKANRGWLVPFVKDTRNRIQSHLAESEVVPGSALLYVLETGEGDQDIAYLCKNSHADAIDLDVLDLCWTNDSGHLVLDPGKLAVQYELFLPGQQKRALHLIQKAQTHGFRNQEIFGSERQVTLNQCASQQVGGVSSDQRVAYPIQRVFQLGAEFAAAALSSLSQSISRPAFGHDYLRAGH